MGWAPVQLKCFFAAASASALVEYITGTPWVLALAPHASTGRPAQPIAPRRRGITLTLSRADSRPDKPCGAEPLGMNGQITDTTSM